MTTASEMGYYSHSVKWAKKISLFFFTFENSRLRYACDFIIYGVLLTFLFGFIVEDLRRTPLLIGIVLAGWASWTLTEYLLHRFVLHGVQPFRRWHEMHHAHPQALITIATLLSLTLFAVLIFVPAMLLLGVHHAAQFLFGMIAGYFFYATVHHADHHWHASLPFFKRSKQWHSLHHRSEIPICFGVTTQFWDDCFGTDDTQYHPIAKPSPSAAK